MEAAHTSQSLQETLRRFRARLRAVYLTGGAAWGIVAAVALLVAGMWIDLMVDLPPLARVVVNVLVFAGGVGLFVFAGWRFVADAKDAAIASRLDRAGRSRGEILSGVDLMNAAAELSPTTAGLAMLATERASVLAARVSPADAVPASRLRLPSLSLIAALIAVILIALVAPKLASTEWSRFTDPYGDHPPFTSFTLNVDPGNVRVAYGSPLNVRLSIDRPQPLERVELVLDNGSGPEKLPMFEVSGGKWEATIARVTSPAKYFVRAAGARSHKFAIDVLTVPQIQSVKFRVTPPAYTHRAPYEGPLPQGGIAGLVGTKVELWARSNRPLQGGEMPFTSSATTQPTIAPVDLEPTSPGSNEITGSFIVGYPGKYVLRVKDEAGQVSAGSAIVPVSVLADGRPFVRILEPKANSFATPDVTLNVQVLAEDDYGVSKVQLFRSLNGSHARREDLRVPAAQPMRVAANVPLKLDDYGVSPGDTVELYARVEDNDPAGAKGSESPVVTVKIISKQELNRMLIAKEGMDVLESKYDQANRRLEAAMHKMDELHKKLGDKDRPLTDAEKRELDQLATDLKDAAEAVGKTAKDDLPFDLDKPLRKELEATAKALDDAAKKAEAMAKRPGLSTSICKAGLSELLKKLGDQKDEVQHEAVAPLEYLAKIFPLMEDQARYLDLWERQKDLAERMRSLREQNADDPQSKARMRDLETEQRVLREELTSLLADIDNHVHELPEDKRLDPLRKSATDFAKAVRGSGAAEQMASCESFLSELKGAPAGVDAQAAADTLEKFIGKCNGMGKEAGTCLKFQPKLASGMGNTVKQLLDAEGLGKSSRGNGVGTGGGYSERRSTLRNVGIYGTIPTRGKVAGSRPGGSADTGAGTWSEGRNPNAEANATGSTISKSNASGASDASVPAQYRQRVGEYFQRVADELGDQ